MKPQYKRRMVPAMGINDILVPPLGAAENIINCRYNDRGGWCANMGTESWWSFPSSLLISTDRQPRFILIHQLIVAFNGNHATAIQSILLLNRAVVSITC